MNQPARVGEPVRPIDPDPGQGPIDGARSGEEKEEDQGDGHRGDDRGEIERRTEERPTPEELLVHQDREHQRQGRLEGNHADHIEEGVAQRGHEVLASQARLGEQIGVVRNPDELGAPAEGAASSGPVADGHPQGHDDREDEEESEDDDHRGDEEPAGDGGSHRVTGPVCGHRRTPSGPPQPARWSGLGGGSRGGGGLGG